MYCGRTANAEINRVHKRALRAIYNDDSLDLDDLLRLDGSVKIHTKNLRMLLLEIFKSLRHLNPPLMWSMFSQKLIPYHLRNSNLLQLPQTVTTKYGTNSFIFRGSLLWNNLHENLKTSRTKEQFKKSLLLWDGQSCTCQLCK